MNSATASVCQGLVEQIRSQLFSEEFRDRHRRAKRDFTRKRCLPFAIVVIFLLNMVKRALQDELDEFFKFLNQQDVAVRIVTKSAFSQARKKLKQGLEAAGYSADDFHSAFAK